MVFTGEDLEELTRFVPRGALELILHAHDVCTGLGVAFEPADHLCQRLRHHTRSWPHWSMPGWAPLAMTGAAWPDLLRGSGRNGTERQRNEG